MLSKPGEECALQDHQALLSVEGLVVRDVETAGGGSSSSVHDGFWRYMCVNCLRDLRDQMALHRRPACLYNVNRLPEGTML